MKYWEIYVFCMDNGYDTTAQTLQCILWPALRSSELDIQYRRQFLGSGDGAVVRALASHQFDPGMSLLLVLALLRGFSSGFSSFPPPTKKTAFPNSNSTRLEGLNENPLFLSKYFNSNFYFSLCNKDRRASRGQKKGGHWNVVLWNTGFSMISDKQLSNLVERSVSWWVINQRDGRGRVLATLTLKTLESAGLS